MERTRQILTVALVASVLVAGFGAYWEWSRPAAPPATSGCPSLSDGGLGGAPPIVFTLNSRTSWTSWEGPGGYTYNVTFEYLVPTASTNWTGFDLINRTFTHSPISYTVSVWNSSFGTEALFTSSQSSWRSEGGPGPTEALLNWTPTKGVPITSADVLVFHSQSDLAASGLYFQLEMAAGQCGPWEEQPFVV